jgi:hypothetical protein
VANAKKIQEKSEQIGVALLIKKKAALLVALRNTTRIA